MHLAELKTQLTRMLTEDNLRIYVDAYLDLDKQPEAFDSDLKCLGIFVELLLQLQQFKASSLARFPTAHKHAPLPPLRPPPRAGFFLKCLIRTPLSALLPARPCRAGKTFIRRRQ